MIDSLLELDSELFVFLNSLGSPTWDGLWLVITNKFASIPIYAVLLFLVFKKYGWRVGLTIIIVTALMITFTDQLTNFFKDTVKRPRPCQEESLNEVIRYIAPRCGKFSFFSGHATSTMAGAVFISLLLRKWFKYLPFIMVFWAFLVAYSRIYVGVHYPIDIIVGMAVGGLAGWLFYKLQQFVVKRLKLVE
jgi:undecaprenyl-diphosphatase